MTFLTKQDVIDSLYASLTQLHLTAEDSSTDVRERKARRSVEELLADSNAELSAAINEIAALKKSSKYKIADRDAKLKMSDDLLLASNEKLAAVNQQLLAVNEELAHSYQQLKISEKMQRDFINIAAHELRTPIGPILGVLDLLRSGEVETKEGLEIIARSAARLQRLANDILNVARIENNSLTLNRESFNIHEMVTDAIDDQRVAFERDGKEENLKIVFENGTENNLLFYGDKEKLSEVVYNLLSNAIKFTEGGTIVVTLEMEDNNLIFKVIDSGSGISDAVQQKLFTKFITTSAAGMGLGLYISKNIVEAHNGKIWSENNKNGKGATFAFSVPVEVAIDKGR